MSKRGTQLSPRAAKKLFESSRYVEQLHRNQAPALSGSTDFGGGTMLLVTTALNPMSGANPGTNGQGKIQQFDGTSYSDLSATVYPILNDQEKNVAVGAYVLCVPGPGGMFHMVTVDKCSNLD